jgi:uncharacterized protein YhbP (UPF0306 family)
MVVQTVRGRLTDPRIRASLVRILRGSVLASFSTVDTGGLAHINTAYYAWSADWSLYFYSFPDARHCRNLEGNPSMAAAVFDSHQRWGKPDRGVQLFGIGCEATGAIEQVAAATYSHRFPGFERWRSRRKQEDGAFLLRPYRLRPDRAKILDERVLGGGRFVEVMLPKGRVRR